MIGHGGGGGGERCQNAQKQNFIKKTYQELILYKPVGNINLQWHVLGFSYDCVPSN